MYNILEIALCISAQHHGHPHSHPTLPALPIVPASPQQFHVESLRGWEILSLLLNNIYVLVYSKVQNHFSFPLKKLTV